MFARKAAVLSAAQFGVPRSRVKELTSIATRLLNDGMLGLPNIFMTQNCARSFAARFIRSGIHPVVVGTGLRPALVERVRQTFWSGNSRARPGGLETALRMEQRLDEPERALGFEVAGSAGEQLHSWRLQRSMGASGQFGNAFAALNRYGLIEDERIACETADAFCHIGAEPSIWWPWLLVSYGLVLG
jgi:hypothetical protein